MVGLRETISNIKPFTYNETNLKMAIEYYIKNMEKWEKSLNKNVTFPLYTQYK